MFRTCLSCFFINNKQTIISDFLDTLEEWSRNESLQNPHNESNIITARQKIENCYNLSENSLDLSDLELSSLPPNFHLLNKLKYLNLSNNQFQNFQPEIFRIKELKTLNIANNNISTIPQETEELTNLENLNISLNQIDSIPEQLLNMENFRNLTLHNNQISQPSEALQTIMLSRNINILYVKNPANITPYEKLLNLAKIDIAQKNDIIEFFENTENLGINKTFDRLMVNFSIFKTDNFLTKKQLATDLLNIYEQIYLKKDDNDFMFYIKQLCLESLAGCEDRNIYFAFELANYSKQKSFDELKSLSPQEQYKYLKNQALFDYIKKLSNLKIADIRSTPGGTSFKEDIEVNLNYLRIFSKEFSEKYELDMPSIYSQNYFNSSTFGPSKEELDNFRKMLDDNILGKSKELNTIIANYMADNYSNDNFTTAILSEDKKKSVDIRLANINEKFSNELAKLDTYTHTSLDYLSKTKNIDYQKKAKIKECLEEFFVKEIENILKPSLQVSSSVKENSDSLQR